MNSWAPSLGKARVCSLNTGQMSIYMSRLLPKSNSSFLLRSGNALQSNVLRLSDDKFLVDAGIGTPKIVPQDELTRIPPANLTTRFENKVGYIDQVSGETQIRRRFLERFFIDLVAGDMATRVRAAARFNDMVGSSSSSTDVAVAAGEPNLVLPMRFRQKRAWMELNKAWRTNTKVRGFVIDRVKGGYSVAIAGFICFMPYKPFINRRLLEDRFGVESINQKRANVVLS